MKVLIAEDNEIDQLIANEFFQKFDWDSKLVVNGKEAVEAATLEEFDLVLLDIDMPVKNGFEAVKEIRLIEKDYISRMPIIALTAKLGLSEDEVIGIGFNSMINKPLNLNSMTILDSLYNKRDPSSPA